MAPSATTGNRPRPLTILAAAFLAGGAAAVGLNYFLDAHLAQRKPVVESEPIFIAMRSLPAGAPVTVWDVALRNWPKAMLPTTAMRVEDSFEGMQLKMALREGQPLLSVQLEPTMSLAKVANPSGVGDEEMVVLDDRTKIQVNWPAKPAKTPAATDAAQVTQPAVDVGPTTGTVDDRFAIRPITPAPATNVQAELARVEPTPTAQLGAIAPPDPVTTSEAVPPVVDDMAGIPAPQTTAVASTQPAVVAEQEPVESVEAIAVPPVIAEPTPAPAVAEVPTLPTPAVASLPSPVAPPTPAIVPSQRHLVVPERIAVMADDITRQPVSQPVLAEASTPPSAMRKVTPLPETSSSAPTRAASASTTLTQQDALSAAMRPNPLRSRSTSPSPVRSIVTPTVPAAPVTTRVQPQGGLNVPPVIIPQDELPPSRSSRTTSSQDAVSNTTDDNEDGRFFPRMSARIEKAGEDWNRFRDSVFGTSEEE
ncbi:MAG: hypothetical protein ACO3NZ_01255 [Pirellulales bacterium]|jgi:hypothetical protein